MAYGTWVSQFNARAIATPFSIAQTQTGVVNGRSPNYLSQMLLDDSAPPGAIYGNSFGQAASNLKLVAKSYSSARQTTGLAVSLKTMTGWMRITAPWNNRTCIHATIYKS